MSGNQGTFVGHIMGIDGKGVMLGIFDNKIEAAIAYDRAAIKKRSATYLLNFPDMVPKGYTPKKKAKYGEGKHSTPYIGVTVAQGGNGYEAAVWVNKKLENLGVYDTAEKAAITRDRQRRF